MFQNFVKNIGVIKKKYPEILVKFLIKFGEQKKFGKPKRYFRDM